MWSCPVCGFENSDNDIPCLGGCGHLRLARVVILRSNVSDKNVRLHVRTSIGRRLLVNLDRELAVYASERQFTLFPDRAMQGWVIVHDSAAVNSTRLNGKNVADERMVIHHGDMITIGGYPTQLIIELEV